MLYVISLEWSLLGIFFSFSDLVLGFTWNWIYKRKNQQCWIYDQWRWRFFITRESKHLYSSHNQHESWLLLFPTTVKQMRQPSC